jgi:hypothetical protein
VTCASGYDTATDGLGIDNTPAVEFTTVG